MFSAEKVVWRVGEDSKGYVIPLAGKSIQTMQQASDGIDAAYDLRIQEKVQIWTAE